MILFFPVQAVVIVSSSLIILATSYFIAGAIPDMSDLGPDLPIVRDYPRVNPSDPYDVGGIVDAYRSLKEAQQKACSGVYTNNYTYPYLNIKDVTIQGIGDLPKITKNYIGRNIMNIKLEFAFFGDDPTIDTSIVGKMKSALRFDGIAYAHRTCSRGFVIADAINSGIGSDGEIVEWYNSGKDVDEYRCYRQLFVDPLDPTVFKVCDIEFRSRNIHSFTPQRVTNLGDVYKRVDFLYSADGSFITPDTLVISYVIDRMAITGGLTFEEAITIFSQNLIHPPRHSQSDLLMLTFPSGNDYLNFTPPDDSSAEWYARFILVFAILSVTALGAAYYGGAI